MEPNEKTTTVVNTLTFAQNATAYVTRASDERIAIQRPDGKIVVTLFGPVGSEPAASPESKPEK